MSRHGKTVVIVDDMEHVCAELDGIYKTLGLAVVGHAHNGVDGLELVESLKPDLVSMDIIMPEMDGVECFRTIKHRAKSGGHDPQVLFISYLASEPKIVEAYQEEIPPEYLLPKGVSVELIKSRLNQMFGVPDGEESETEVPTTSSGTPQPTSHF